jgi:hypothetical protein
LGGYIERKKNGVTLTTMCNRLLRGELDKAEYNVLCKVCNMLHYVESLDIIGHVVVWNKQKGGESI